MKGILLFLCFLTLAATVWLGVMEVVLEHPGFGLRACIAILLASQSLCTILFLVFRGPGRVRVPLMISGGLIAVYGISAIASILKAAHFEGYVLVIGFALVLQGVLTIVGLTIAPKLRLPF